MQRRPTLNWLCHFTPLLHTDIKIHASYEKYASHKRNVLHVTIVFFEYTVYTVRKEKLFRKLAPEKNFNRVCYQEGKFQCKAVLLCMGRQEAKL